MRTTTPGTEPRGRWRHVGFSYRRRPVSRKPAPSADSAGPRATRTFSMPRQAQRPARPGEMPPWTCPHPPCRSPRPWRLLGRHECESCPMARVRHRPAPSPPWRRASAAGACCGAARPCFAPATPCSILYQLRAGSLKIRVTNHAGLEQITAFPASGAPARARRHRKRLPCLRRHRAGRFPAMRPAYAQLVANCGLDRWPRASSTA